MAKKIKNSLLTMTMILFIIASVAAFSLASVSQMTKEPIEQQKVKKEKAAIWQVFSDAEKSTKEKTVYLFDTTGVIMKKRAFATKSEPKSATFYKQDIPSDSISFFDLYKDEIYLGSAIKTLTNKGFSGRIELMVGIDSSGVICGTTILSHQETPGLGDKMDASKSDFAKQFWGSSAEDLMTNNKFMVKKDGGKIDAITASTISSRAFCDAMQTAYDLFKEHKIGGNK